MIIPGMPMCLPTGMSEEQRTTYISEYLSEMHHINRCVCEILKDELFCQIFWPTH
jgi:hypothetical protein